MTFFTSDCHFGHSNIIDYCNRPFHTVEEMDETIIENWNQVVNPNDTVYHVGDFTFDDPFKYLKRLKGNIIFLKGNHDAFRHPVFRNAKDRLVLNIEKITVVLDHFCMRVWPKSHYNSFHLFGHSHGTLEPIGKSWDVGVDNNDFRPISWEQIKEIMKNRPDNFNFIKRRCER